MEEFSITICNERRLIAAIYNVHDEPTTKNWEKLLAAANMINRLAINELTQLKAELAELTTSAMNVTYPLDADGEELATKERCDLNYAIQEITQQFIDINDIRIGAQQESERARQALASQHS